MEKYNKEVLINLILEQNKSYSSIGKLYGVSGASIKKAARRLGISLPKRREVNKNENFSHPRKTVKTKLSEVSDEDFIEIVKTSNTWKELGERLGYVNALSSNVKKSVIDRCSKLGMECQCQKQETFILDMTKGEIFGRRKNWQSARSSIRKIAKDVYFEHNKHAKCEICGYDKHIEVAHIKAVSEFDDDVTIREINSIGNLIGLCPNHHWEYDHGILKL